MTGTLFSMISMSGSLSTDTLLADIFTVWQFPSQTFDSQCLLDKIGKASLFKIMLLQMRKFPIRTQTSGTRQT